MNQRTQCRRPQFYIHASRPKRDHVDAARHGPGDRIDVRCAVPEWRMRTLDWLCDCQVVLEFLEPAVEVQHLCFAGVHQDRECLVVHRLRRGRIYPIALMLEQRPTATNAKLQPPSVQVVEHTDLLVKPQRMMQGEDVDQRTESDPPSPLRHGGEKHARRRRHPEPCRMMLCDMIGVITLGFEYADELQPILELLTERCPIVIKMIEDAELKAYHDRYGTPR